MNIDFNKNILFSSLELVTADHQSSVEQLIIAGQIFQYSNGTIALSGKPAQIFAGISHELKKVADSFEAEELVLPSSITLGNFQKTEYSNFFPQFTSYLTNESKTGSNRHEYEAPKSACCSAVCLNCYPMLQDARWKPTEQRVFTMAGRVFRNEAENTRSPYRLCEFHVRDLVFMGSEVFVKNSLMKCVNWMIEFLRDCELCGIVQVANDPFFSSDAESLRAYQQANRSKFELCLKEPLTNEKIAVASVNNHANHFAKAFDIRFNNQSFIHTGCFGVGFERLALLIIQQYGCDEALWPQLLRARFFHSDRHQ